MSGFSADWLHLREPVDAVSRHAALAARLHELDARQEELCIIDLATGTGANLRYLAPRLGGRQRWVLVDQDVNLLAACSVQMTKWAAARGLRLDEEGAALRLHGPDLDCRLERRVLDLASALERLALDGAWLVTASALLDLVSEAWLRSLAERCVTAGARVLFTLSYDGRSGGRPRFPYDGKVRALVNRHQRTDKGFGRALGPDAAQYAAECFAERGYRVVQAASDWHLGPAHAALQSQLVAGWAAAAATLAPRERSRLATWAQQRQALIAQGRSRVMVGHRDLLAWPR